MEKRNIVGVRVRQARKAARLPITQTDLVARLQILGMQIDESSLSKIESGRPVTDIEVVALARALKVSVAWLLKEIGTSNLKGTVAEVDHYLLTGYNATVKGGKRLV